MARFLSSHPEVRALVDDLLVPGFIATGNISALTREIGALAGAPPGQPHPARISTLLSDDAAKGVNEGTVELLRRAAAVNPWTDGRAWKGSRDEISATVRPHAAAGLAAAQIAELVSLPPAVVRAALPTAPTTASPNPVSDEPDWSFQDVAVERCLKLLKRQPFLNVGLVLPTGAGKTRTAIRVILEMLADVEAGARAVWVTHRHLLREQVTRELAKLIDNPPAGLPANVAALVERLDIVMVSDVRAILDCEEKQIALLVIDEAHHAAAPSYAPIFQGNRDFPTLLLTATPIRTDDKAIHIDEIAYTVTYRELAEKNAIIIPTFEPLPVDTFEMTSDVLEKIAEVIVKETGTRFRKTLVVTSRVEHVEALAAAVADKIEHDPHHPLHATDVGFIHGLRNSHDLGDEAMLALFASKPRAVLVSAQMLLEGFDDPTIDSVVITYATSSIITLMQAAGRAVRRSPGKKRAWVMQVDNPALAYRFDERWLYQEISDRVRPRIEEIQYRSIDELEKAARAAMETYNVAEPDIARIIDQIQTLDVSDTPRLLFYGLPYFGKPEQFAKNAEWGVFLETRANSQILREAFNQYCAISPQPPDPSEFLDARAGLIGLPDGRSRLRRDLTAVLSAAYFARVETDERGGAAQDRRGYTPHGATTWLRYVTTRRILDIPDRFKAFLADCHNGTAIAAAYLDDPSDLTMAIKVALPVGVHEAVLLDRDTADKFVTWLNMLETALRSVDPYHQLARLTSLLAELPSPPLAPLHLSRCEPMIARAGRSRLTYELIDMKE